MITKNQTIKAWGLTLTVTLLSACNSNLFEGLEKPKPADEAAAYLDQGKSDEAISVLNNALKDEPDNNQYKSMLASAKAQKAGLDTLDIVLRLADKAGDSSNEPTNPLTSLFVVLPDATDMTRQLMLECVSLLNSIPETQRTNDDNFKGTFYNAAFTALQTKYFDADGDGKFSIEELSKLDDESASAILDSLINAATSSELFQSEAGGSDSAAAEKVATIRAEIDAQPGDNTVEKLRSYLGGSGATLPAQP